MRHFSLFFVARTRSAVALLAAADEFLKVISTFTDSRHNALGCHRRRASKLAHRAGQRTASRMRYAEPLARPAVGLRYGSTHACPQIYLAPNAARAACI